MFVFACYAISKIFNYDNHIKNAKVLWMCFANILLHVPAITYNINLMPYAPNTVPLNKVTEKEMYCCASGEVNKQ